MIDHCGVVWGRLRPEPSLGRRADNVIIPLDLTQLFYPGFTLAAGPPSGFTTDIVGCWGGACGEPAISLYWHTVPLVQWSTCLLPIMRDPGSTPRGVLMWNRDSPDSVFSLQYFTQHNDLLQQRVFWRRHGQRGSTLVSCFSSIALRTFFSANHCLRDALTLWSRGIIVWANGMFLEICRNLLRCYFVKTYVVNLMLTFTVTTNVTVNVDQFVE